MPKGPDHPWTCRELHRLESLRLDGLTVAQIATRMGRTRASVHSQAKRMGFRKVRRLELWLPLFWAGRSMQECAERMGVNIRTARSYRQQARKGGWL